MAIRKSFLPQVLWLCCAFMIPVTIFPPGYHQYELPKILLLRALVLGMVTVIVSMYGPSLKDLLHSHSKVTYTVMGYAVLLLLSTLFSSNVHLSLWGNYERHQGILTRLSLLLLYLCMVWGIQTKHQWNAIWWALVLGSLPVTIIGLAQWLSPRPTHALLTPTIFLTSTLGRSNFVGSYLVLLIPLTAASGWDRWHKSQFNRSPIKGNATWHAGVLGLLCAGQVTCLLATQARAAWLGLGVSLLFSLFMIAYHCPTSQKWLRLVGVLCLCAFASIVVLLAIGSDAAILSHLRTTFDFTRGSTAARWTIWRTVSNLIRKRPLLGYGLDTLRVNFIRHYPPELVFYQGRYDAVDRAHNIWLDTLYHTGFLGLLGGVVLWMVVAHKLAGKLRHPSTSGSMFNIALGAALIGHLVEQQFSFETTTTATVVYSLAALVMASPSTQDQVTPVNDHKVSFTTVTQLTLSMALITLITIRPLKADIAYNRAQCDDQPADVRLESAQQAVNLWPLEVQYWVTLARLRAETGTFKGADNALTRVLQLEPGNPHIYAVWGDLYASQLPGSIPALEQAVTHYQQAVQLAPTVAGYHTALGMTLGRLGEYAASRDSLERAAELDPTDPVVYAELVKTYTALGEAELAEKALRDAQKWMMEP